MTDQRPRPGPAIRAISGASRPHDPLEDAGQALGDAGRALEAARGA